MATKKKDLSNQDTTGIDIPEAIKETVSGDISAELPAVIQTAEDTGNTALDLNELLSSMDQQSDTENGSMMEDSESAAPATEDTERESLSSEIIVPDVAESPTANKEENEDSIPSDDSSDSESGTPPTTETETPKPKRISRKKETTEVTEKQIETDPEENESESSSEQSDTAGTVETKKAEATAPVSNPIPARRTPRSRVAEAPVLTIDARSEVETEEEREDTIWHEIHNAYRTRRILTGELGGVEQTDTGKTIAIVDYKGFRIVIPLKEMMINLGRMPSGQEYADLMLRQNKILGNMLGAEIDFIVMGIDSKTRSVVASRKEAVLKKRQIFYLDTDAAGMYRIYEGRIVQARIIAVAEKVIRVEIFGVECSIMARDLAWDWVGDAHERFNVGDQVLVRILSVRRDNPEDIGIRADIKSVSQNPNQDNLKKCRIQSKYAGKVTDVHKGVVYVRLSNGANAVAHSCYDHRTPGKKDDVSFAVTRLDEERGVAVGIITRIIRQNL